MNVRMLLILPCISFLLNEGADPSRFLFVLSHADRVFPAEEWNDTEKMPVPSAGTLTGDSNSPGGNPVPVIISGTLRCRTCRLESSGTGVADDPRTATTGNQRSLFTYPGENRSEQARKHAQQTFGDAIGKSFDAAVAQFSFPALDVTASA